MASAADQLPERVSAQNGAAMPWIPIGCFGLLLVIANYPILKHLVEQWSYDEDFQHGFLVPLVAAYIAWQRRDEILALEFRPSWWGAAIMIWAVIQGYLGVL